MSKGAKMMLLVGLVGSASAAQQVLLVGLYQDTGATVLTYAMNRNASSTTFTPLASSDAGPSPSWIISAHGGVKDDPDGDRRSLLAVHETNGTVSTLLMDCKGSVVESSRVSSGGAMPVFLATSPQRDNVLVANYGAGSVSVLPLSWKDGQAFLKQPSQTVEFGANAHAHSAYFQPDCPGECPVFVPTLGLDKVQQLAYSQGKLSQAHAPLTVPPQQGPRHLAFHPKLPIAVLSNEGSGTVAPTIELLAVQADGLKTIATYSASGPYGPPKLFPAEVLFTEKGGFVLVSLRDATDQKRDGVASFKVAEDGSKLTAVDYAAVGHYPRSMTLDKSGLLIVGNQKANSLSFLQLNFETGKLVKAREELDVKASPGFVDIFDLPSGCSSYGNTIVV